MKAGRGQWGGRKRGWRAGFLIKQTKAKHNYDWNQDDLRGGSDARRAILGSSDARKHECSDMVSGTQLPCRFVPVIQYPNRLNTWMNDIIYYTSLVPDSVWNIAILEDLWWVISRSLEEEAGNRRIIVSDVRLTEIRWREVWYPEEAVDDEMRVL